MTATTTDGAPSALRALAERVGIIAEYRDQTGRETRATTDATRVALLAAIGIDASTAAAAERALAALDAEHRAELFDPVRVVVAREGATALDVTIEVGKARAPDDVRPDAATPGGDALLDWTLELSEENGSVHTVSGRSLPAGDGALRIELAWTPTPGYHRIRATVGADESARVSEQSLIAVPPACPSPVDVLDGRRVFGITANLYAVRSTRNWGVGDLTDLATLLCWAAREGADFVGVNPLHALRNRDGDISPYSPISRLFRNPLYIDVEAIPGFSESAAVREIVGQLEFREELARVRASDRVLYARVMALKTPVFRALHAEHRSGPGSRDPVWTQWIESEGPALDLFATFIALSEHLGEAGQMSADWRDWPAEYRDARSAAVQRFRETHESEIDFHRWLQFVIDRQLAAAAETARDSGMAIGLYQDLAIGTAPNGSDPWSFPALFVGQTSVGSPPDPYSASGQNWGLPPIDPRALRRQRYEYWIRLVRSSLRHGGALRIDHVMGLFRQFWIPEGMSGTAGAYMRFPSEELLGILALESTRGGALIVGEDLGTVPDDVPPAMRRWQLLGSKVLYFEREWSGAFRSADSYAADSLATVNTHDLPTIEGFWRGDDISLRRTLGLIESDDAAAAERAGREGEKRALLERLVAEGVLEPGAAAGEPSLASIGGLPNAWAAAGPALRAALHEFLCRTPAALVGLSLADVVGEVEPVNVPGVGHDRFSSWTRRLAVSLEELDREPGVAASIHCSRATRREHGGGSARRLQLRPRRG